MGSFGDELASLARNYLPMMAVGTPFGEKISYFLKSIWKKMRDVDSACPSCGEARSELISTKYWATELRRCQACQLLFRSPTISPKESKSFYQERYRQGFTTDMPDAALLRRLTATHFEGTEKDYGRYVEILNALGVPAGARVLDFGCSWGYGSWQLGQAGYSVESFEISIPRANYAREQLGCKVYSELSQIGSDFDVFFSAHVLEHVPSPSSILGFAADVLRGNGLFLAFTPNGAAAHRTKDPQGWQASWGLVHPNLLDDVYYRAYFGNLPYLLASQPYDVKAIAAWGLPGDQQVSLDTSGGELMCAARPKAAM